MLFHSYSKQAFYYSSSKNRGGGKYLHWSVWEAPDQWVFKTTVIWNCAVYSSISSTACLFSRGKWSGSNASPLESRRNGLSLPSLCISASQDGKLVGGKGTILLNSLPLFSITFLLTRTHMQTHTKECTKLIQWSGTSSMSRCTVVNSACNWTMCDCVSKPFTFKHI